MNPILLMSGLQIHAQHWGGWSAYFGDLLDIGGGGMILRFLISGSCYAQSHAFSTNFLQIFLDDLFLLAKLFSHISCKNPLKPINIYHILHLPYPQIFSLLAWWKNISNGQKSKLLGDGGQILGGCIPPPPPRDLQPWLMLSMFYF